MPEAELVELRRRIDATRFPERETVTDASQGVQLATIQKLARYWATQYDWRKCEARLQALPHFITEIDGLDIHFIHVRSKHKGALPMIITHGWPGSIVEQLKIIDPLTNPTAHGGSASDAFDVVIPSMPGYGYSGKPAATGWDSARIAPRLDRADEAPRLQALRGAGRRLGRDRRRPDGRAGAPEGLVGIHTNMAGVFPADIDGAAFCRRAGASGPLRRREASLTSGLQFVTIKRESATAPDGAAPADTRTESRTRPSAWPLTSSTTTRAATSSSRAPSTDSPRA